MKKKYFYTLLLAFIFVYKINGQVVPPPVPPPPPPGLPINGGIIFLLISGLVYGIKKIRK